MIHKIGREIHDPDLYVFPVHEFFKMIADKFPRFAKRTLSLCHLRPKLCRIFLQELIHGDRCATQKFLQ